MNCPLNKYPIYCLVCEFEKEGLCDYPYKKGLSLEEIKKLEANND